MIFGISTHWNAYRHKSGEAVIEEILALGFNNVELGYDLTLDLVPGVKKMTDNKTVSVKSVHNFCPVPVGAPYGHPELFSLSDTNNNARKSAVHHTVRTIEFASTMGASSVVAHAGNVDMGNITRKLIELAEQGKQYTTDYEKLKIRLFTKRDKIAGRHLDALFRSIEELMPILEVNKVRLAFENLPSWESIPAENEMEDICKRFNPSQIGYWHDFGHGQIRQNLGFISHRLWLEKLSPYLVGTHIHDVKQPVSDHLMPPKGNIDFKLFKKYIRSGILLILEPAPGTPDNDILEGVKILNTAWNAGEIKEN